MSTAPIEVLYATPMQVGESPLWHPKEEALYWIDIPARMVHCHHLPTAAHRSWQMPAEPGCIVRCATGGLIVAMRSGIAHFDTATGALTELAAAPYDTTRMRFNDGRCDAAGRLWVGTIYEPRDQPLGSLYCLERGCLINKGCPATVSNGVAFSPDSGLLYHADTTAHRITVYEFDLAQGRVGEGHLFRQFSKDKAHGYGGRPDGAVVDSEGAYWVAAFEGGCILRLSPSGDVLQKIELPVRCPTMPVFGGADLRTLFITTARHNRSEAELAQHPLSGSVLALRVSIAGLDEPSYQP
ncbi:SMP-30/gluconolactonase/LRE family protein [Noviherbaspirillum massiliense]|uniref:SMP-30/gluconolactonase/LRE family protein n=1 Tax=Noviherbaspirillum massiliense TaxID=1465823 RepID=UPI000360E5FA|nr:SMP-30/gluconolactonase/LRE family protein [Noviherbaspirillum massiliense]